MESLPEEKRRGRLIKRKGNKPQFDMRGELFRMLVGIRHFPMILSPLILLSGHSRNQETKWLSVFHLLTSHPASLIMVQPDSDCLKDGSQLPTSQQQLSSRTVPSAENQAGTPLAIKPIAAKLARLVYRMLRYGMQFVNKGAEFYEAQHRRQVRSVRLKTLELGFQIIEVEAPPA